MGANPIVGSIFYHFIWEHSNMKFYNSLTFKKEEFTPIEPGKVLMYVCGPTVYDSPHLGHAKSAVAFDIIRRYFKYKGLDVKMVKNYTDIDDKIIKRAKERGMSFKALSDKYIEEYEDVMTLLNMEEDSLNPRVTDLIDYIIEFVKALIEKGNAYESNGSVYFDVTTYPDYKHVLQNTPDEEKEEEGEEEEEDSKGMMYGDKKNLKDFALWKAKKKEHEPSWKSPWGEGRPGWHIECSAMAIKYLGETIDIHGGGQDLKFPHHRNEIAQSEAYTGKKFAQYFMHNGFVNVDDEKMSKSLGNFFLVSDVAKEYDPMVIRYFLLTSHYRSSINYSLETMTQAKKNYEKLTNAIEKVQNAPTGDEYLQQVKDLSALLKESREKIIAAMDDDFNTPILIAELMILIRELNRAVLEEKIGLTRQFKDDFFDFIEDLDQILGIFPDLEKIKQGFITESAEGELTKELLTIIGDVRSELRKRKLYELSDEIRDRLSKLGIQLEDR